MSTVKVGENESLDNAIRRFKRKCARDGIIGDLRKKEAYEKPSVKRKKKAEAARKRAYNSPYGGIAQSVRALVSHTRGHRFESCCLHHKQTKSNQILFAFSFCRQRVRAYIGFYGSDAHHGLDMKEGSLAALRHGAGEEGSFFVKRKAPIVVGAFIERCVVGDHHFVIVEEDLLHEGAYK